MTSKEVFIKATRSGKNFENTYQNFSRKDFLHVNLAADIPVLLQSATSLTYSSDAGNGVGYTNLSLRGSDAQRIQVNINGVPYNDAESQSVFWVNLPDLISSAEDIQIQRGVGYSTVGGSSFGGNINIRTIGKNKEASLNINSSIGSFGTFKWNLQGATAMDAYGWQATARISQVQSNGYIERAAANLASFYMSIGKYSSNWSSHLVLFSGKEKTYQAWNGLSDDEYRQNRRGNNSGTDWGQKQGAPYNNQIDNYFQTNIQWVNSIYWSANHTSSITAYTTLGKGYFEEYKVAQDLSTYYPSVSGTSDLVRRRWLDNGLYGIQMAHNIDFDGLENTTMLSANIYQGTHDGHIVQVFDMPSYSNLNPYYLTHSEKSDWIAFNKLSIKSGSFRWIADLQVRNVNYMSRGTTQDGLRNFDAHYFFFNPKFGINYTIDSRHKIYLFSGIGQKEPNRNDFTDASQGRVPKPEKMFNIEIGYNFRSKEVLLENNFYAMLYQDQLVQTGAVNDVGAYIRQNVDKSYRLGWEQRFEWQVVPKIRFKSSQTLSVNKIVEYTYTIPAYNVDYTININATSNTVLKNVNLAFSPSWISYLELAYQPTKNLTMTLMNKSVSSQYLDNTASDLKAIPFYNFLNLSVEQKIHPSFCKEIRFNLLLNNLLNHLTYTNGYTNNSGIFVDQNNQKSTPVDYNYVYPQAGFNVMMGIHMGF